MKVCDAEASGAYIQQAREAARVAGLAVPSHAEKWDGVPKRVWRTRLVRVRECGDGWRRMHTVKMQVQHNVRAGARAGVDTRRRNNGYFLA